MVDRLLEHLSDTPTDLPGPTGAIQRFIQRFVGEQTRQPPPPRARPQTVERAMTLFPAPPFRRDIAAAYSIWVDRHTGAQPPTSQAHAFALLVEPYLREQPELYQLFLRDFTTLVAVVEARDLIGPEFRDGIIESVPYKLGLSDKLLAATDEQLGALSHRLLTAEAALIQGEAHRQFVESLETTALGAVSDPELASALSEAGLGEAGPALLVGRFLDPLQGRPLTWLVSDDRLVAFVATEGGGSGIFDIDLDHPIGSTAIDAVTAITSAVFGRDHRVRRRVDPPGQQTGVGWFFQHVLGPPSNFVFGIKDRFDAPLNAALGGEARSSRQIVAERMQRLTAEVEQVLSLDSDQVLLTAVAAALPRELPEAAVARMGFAWWESLDPAARNEVEAVVTTANRERIEAAVAEAADTRHSGRRFLDELAGGVGSAALMWEAFVQNNFVSTADFVGDLARGTFKGVQTLGTGQAWEAFRSEFSRTDADTAAEFFGVEDTEWSGLVNLAGSIAGDPFTWLIASPMVRGAFLSKQMTTPVGVNQLLRHPQMQRQLRLVSRSQETGDTRLLVGVLAGSGISREGVAQLLNGLPVEQVFYREMTQRNMLPALLGGARLRNQGVLVRSMAASGDDRLTDFLRRSLSERSGNRTISLGPQFYDDMLPVLMAMADSPSVPEAVWRGFLDELLVITNPNRTVARQQLALAVEAKLSARRELVREAQDQGYRRFLRDEETIRQTAGRIERHEAEMVTLRRGAADPAEAAAEVERTLDEWVVRQTPETRQAWQDAVAAERGLADTAARLEVVDRTIDLLRSGDARLTEARGALARARATGDEAAVAAARQTYDELAAAVREAGTPLPDGLTPGSAELVERRAGADEWLGRWRDSTREMEHLRFVRRRLDAPAGREGLAEFVGRLMDTWGEAAGLGKPGTITWGRVTGAEPARGVLPSIADLLNQAAPEASAAIRDLNLISIRGAVSLPVNPWMLLAYDARHSSRFWSKIVTPNPVRRQDTLSRLVRFSRTVWYVNVLTSPFRWVRSGLDPIFRDIYRHGYRRGTRRGAERIEIAFTGRTPELSDIANVYTARLRPPFIDPEAADAPLVSARRSHARWAAANRGVSPGVSKGEFMYSARRFFNGVLPNSSPGLRPWAQSRQAGTDAVFMRWWNEEGGRLLAPAVYDMAGGAGRSTPIVFREGYDQMLEALLDQLAPSARDAARASIIKAWAAGDEVPASVLRQFKVLPAMAGAPRTVAGRIFERSDARPHRIWSARLFEQFVDDNTAVLLERHRLSGRLLDADRLASISGITPVEAAGHLARSSPQVAETVARHGLVTPAMIRTDATSMARAFTGSMDYQMGAVTLAGKRLQELFPFLRAQLDMWGFWWNELMSGTEAMLNPLAQKALRSVPGLRRVVDPAVPFLGRPVAIPGLPLNLRLAGRMADFAGTIAAEGEVAEGDDLLQRLMRNYSFVPADFSNDLWLQVAPGLAPLPSWLLHSGLFPIEVDDEAHPLFKAASTLRRFLDAAWPAFDFVDEEAGARDLVDFIIPDSRLTLRRLASRGLGTVADVLGGQLNVHSFPALLQTLFGGESPDWSEWAPPGFYPLLREKAAAALTADPTLTVGGAEWQDAADELLRQAWSGSTRRASFETAGDLLSVTGFNFDRDDQQFLDEYAPVVEQLPRLNRVGLVQDPLMDEIMELWPRYLARDLSFAEAARLGDRLSKAFFELPREWSDLLILQNPAMTVNAVSQWRCTSQAPAGRCRGSRLVIAPGEEGRELRTLGRRQGWLVRRDPADILSDHYVRYAEAARRMRNHIWTAVTGLSRWSGQEPALGDEQRTVGPFEIDGLRALGADIPAAVQQLVISRTELHDLLARLVDPLRANMTAFTANLPVDALLADTPIPERVGQVRAAMEDSGFDPADPFEWPTETLEHVLNLYRAAVDNGWISTEDYNRDLSPLYGSLDFEPPQPPTLADTEFFFTVDAREIEVLDGDTVRIHYPDGDTQRIRLLGVNAADQFHAVPELHEAYLTQLEDLRRLLDDAEEVAFAIFDTDRFRVTQEIADGEVRWLMWLYVDGRPIWDPAAFSSRRPSGFQPGGEGVRVTEEP